MMKIKALIEEMYKTAPNKGAWYMAMFTVMNNGHFDSSFDYDNKSEFKYERVKTNF